MGTIAGRLMASLESPMAPSLLFDEAAHVYELDGVIVPSVTQTLKASGLIDFSHIPPGILAAALERGRVVHRALHFWNERDLDVGEFIGTYPKYAGYLNAWIAFTEQRRFVPALCERRIASRKHQVAGTLDVLGEMDGVGCLVDYKTALSLASVAPDLQLAAYHALALDWASEDAALAAFLAAHPRLRRFAIQLKRDGTFRVEEYSDPRLFSEFLALLSARRIVERRKGPAAWLAEVA